MRNAKNMKKVTPTNDGTMTLIKVYTLFKKKLHNWPRKGDRDNKLEASSRTRSRIGATYASSRLCRSTV